MNTMNYYVNNIKSLPINSPVRIKYLKSVENKLNKHKKLVEALQSILNADYSFVKNKIYNVMDIDTTHHELKVHTVSDEKKYVNITGDIKIQAHFIKKIGECKKHKGEWCYLPSEDRFYINMGDNILHSYVTKINDIHDIPIKFSEIKPDSLYNTKKIDMFYSPPEIYEGSKDKRQLTNKMKYRSYKTPSSNDKFSLYYRAGSIENLSYDIKHINDEDKRLIYDIAGHFMMVAYLIKDHDRHA